MSSDKKWYQLIFKQLQPIHIGVGSYGVINETRIFIPGWTMWGALTKAYNMQYNNGELSENQNLFEEISCFWPCFDKDGKAPLLPNFKDGEFHLGGYSESKFRAMFVDTFVSTAILPNSRMAKKESLHEIDVILPGSKQDFIEKEKEKEKQLYWTGIVRLDEKTKNDFFTKGLKITIGGDSRYGLGSIELIKIDVISKNSEIFENLNYANYFPVNNSVMGNRIELIVEAVGYKGSKLQLKNPKYCFVPGHMQKSGKIVKGVLMND